MEKPMTTGRKQTAMMTDEPDGRARRVMLPTTASFLIVPAILYFGSDVFLPLAISTLIAFALSPVVSFLRSKGLPWVLAVLICVTVAFMILGLFLAVFASQLSQLVESLPTFQANILVKLEALRTPSGSEGFLGRFVDMLASINAELTDALSSGQPGGAAAAGTGVPVQVAVVESQSAWRILQDVVIPVLSPLVTAGMVIVVVIFMLLEREDLRDRFIRLLGANDLHRTTEMLEDAGSRVANYLIIQLLVNVIYAVPIGLGLWAIGVPNPILWALLTLVLRFVPYVGSALSAAFPLFVALAVSPDWSMVLWTAGLFAMVELVTSNAIEPWLYGSRTGLSPLAIIVAAIVWTFIWGPLGLILSTPLTVCFTVLGRHLPQFEVFEILLGVEPVLAPHSRLYQRILSGDVVESVSRAEEQLEAGYLADYYQTVGIPALLLAQDDYDRGVLTNSQEDRIASSAMSLVQALDYVATEEADEAISEADGLSEVAHDDADRLHGLSKDVYVLVVGGRSRLDEVAAAMLGQAMKAEAARVTTVLRHDVMGPGLTVLAAQKPNCVVLNFLDPRPSRASLLIIRRIKRSVPVLRVGVVFWQMPEAALVGQEAGRRQTHVSEAAARQAEEIGADFVVTSVEAALTMAFATGSAKPLASAPRRMPRKQVRPNIATDAA